MRILSLTYHHVDEFERIYRDAGTPPLDRDALARFLRDIDESHDPRVFLVDVRERPGLLELEFVAPGSGHRYGALFVDMGRAADAVAYWRQPPLYVDDAATAAHGLSRTHALLLAARRLESMR